MPTLLHEVLADIVRKHPYVASVLVEELTGLPLSAMEASKSDANWSDLKPPEVRSDLVLELREPGQAAPSRALIVEVQLRRDERKRWVWPTYVAGLRRRLRCPVLLVVLAPEPSVAVWCEQPIALDEIGYGSVQPLVIGPAAIPVVTRRYDAAAQPELAVLSAIAHGEGPRAASIGKAAIRGFANLDEERARLYSDLVFLHLSDTAQAKLEALMDIEHYDLQSDIAKKLIAQGQAEGAHRALVGVVLKALQHRGVELDAALSTRIEQATSENLERWTLELMSGADIDQIFRDG